MKTNIPCTCSIPQAIDLSQENSAELLLKNLAAFGWSPIVVPQTGVKPPNHQQVSRLFFKPVEATTTSSTSIPAPLIYRDRESGSAGSDEVVPTVEPKESLEISRAQLHVASDHETVRQVQQWCGILSNIAQSVTELLELPPDTFYQSDDASSLDLMRVFYYHAVPDVPNNSNSHSSNQSPPPNALGSSPHTDWGSWTVVWQDSVGGLQTYCRACQTWVSVPPSPKPTGETTATTADTTWRCVLHVGDMASLALGRDSIETNPEMVQWPSPRHRVVCSNQERASLVYFAYPPTHISMTELRERLESWKLEHRGAILPLQEYYLLQDQSASTNGPTTATATLSDEDTSSWTNMPLGQCIQQKWNQVQRS
eukprot:Nitzschia sp. Nitz4//scaffold90_size81538//60322//61425//NITZ4_005325-RA/size81538-processed-gene-0.38-mRNA-1//1//CDS//3329560029//8452//frame0